MLLLSMMSSALAGPVIGVEYVAPGLGDQAWVAEEQLSGTGVASRDGMLVPPFRSFFGGERGRNALIGGFSMARISTTTLTASVGTRSVRMGIRPALTYRRWFMDPKVGAPLAYFRSGVHGVIPYAQERADNPSQEEKRALKESADADRNRIGAVGVHLGAGAEVRWKNGLALGLQTSLVVLRSQASDDQTRTVSSMIYPETALTIAFWF